MSRKKLYVIIFLIWFFLNIIVIVGNFYALVLQQVSIINCCVVFYLNEATSYYKEILP